jgi:MFS family permease
VHNLFFNWTGSFLGTAVSAGGVGIPGNWIMPVMSIGQVAEISTMAILGVTLKRFGWRTTMILGILGHAARFAVFAFFPQYKAAIILINVIHGVAYAFFFATVYIFVDEFFPKDVRASAQGLFNLMILGLGPLVANVLGPQLMGETFKTATGVDFRSLFLVPLTMAIAAAVLLAVAFHPPASKSAQPAVTH